MKLSPRSSGFDVTRLQLRLRTLYPHTKVTGIYDDETERLVRRFQSDLGVTVDGTVDDDLWSKLSCGIHSPTATLELSGNSTQLNQLAQGLKQLGFNVRLDGPSGKHPHVYLTGCQTPASNAAVYPTWSTYPLPQQQVKLLNQVGLVLARTPFEAFCLSTSGVVTPLRVVPLTAEARFVGLRQTGPLRFGYVGPRPDEVAKLFAYAFGSRRDVQLVCHEPTRCQDPRVSTVQSRSPVEWLTPLTALIAVEGNDVVWTAAALGKALILPELTLPDHGLSSDSAYVVPSSFYAGKPVLGLPFSRDELLLAMLSVDQDRKQAAAKGLQAAQRAMASTANETAVCLASALSDFKLLGAHAA